MGVGIAAAFIAIGLGGLRNAVLPKWFAVTTTVMGALALLGACSIPPGGLVNYLLLPFWLIAAADHHFPPAESRHRRSGAPCRSPTSVVTMTNKAAPTAHSHIARTAPPLIPESGTPRRINGGNPDRGPGSALYPPVTELHPNQRIAKSGALHARSHHLRGGGIRRTPRAVD